MSLSPSIRAPTPFYHVDFRSEDNHTSRSSVPSALSSWVDNVSYASQSSSPSPSQQWTTVLLPPHAVNQPPPLSSPNAGYIFPPPAFPTQARTSHYQLSPPPTSYASPPASNRGSVSSMRTSSSSTHTRHGSSARDRSERDGHWHSTARRPLDTVPCQICLEPATVCTCVGGEKTRLRMRKAAREVLDRRADRGESDSRSTHWQHGQEPQVTPQAVGPEYAQGVGYHAAGYSAPMAYAPGSSVPVYSGQAGAMGGYAAGYYYGSRAVVLTSPTRAEGQQGPSGPAWGAR